MYNIPYQYGSEYAISGLLYKGEISKDEMMSALLRDRRDTGIK